MGIGAEEFKADSRQDFVFKQPYAHGCVDLGLVVKQLPLGDEYINVKVPLTKAGDLILGPVDS